MSYVVLREKPLPGESIHSLLIRLAELNDYTFHSFYRSLEKMSPAYQFESLYPNLQFLHYVTGLNLEILADHSCEKWIPLSNIKVVQIVPYAKAQYCPECLNVKHPYHKLVWMVSSVTTCTKHQRALQRSCPGCARSLSIKDIVEAKCRLCGHSLKGSSQVREVIAKEGLQDQLILQSLLTGNIQIPRKLGKYFGKEAYLEILLMFRAGMRIRAAEQPLGQAISRLEGLPHEFLSFLKTAWEHKFLDINLCTNIHSIWFGNREQISADTIAIVSGLSRYFIKYVLGMGLFCEGRFFVSTKQSFLSTFTTWHQKISYKEIAEVFDIPVPQARSLARVCLSVAKDLKRVNAHLVETKYINWQLIFFVLQFFEFNLVDQYLLDEKMIRTIFPANFVLASLPRHSNTLHLTIGLLNEEVLESMGNSNNVEIGIVLEHLVGYIRRRYQKYFERREVAIAKTLQAVWGEGQT